MSLVSIVGILFSLGAIAFVSRQMTTARLWMAVVLFLLHLSTCFYYYQYSLTSIADSYAYYYYPHLWTGQSSWLSTALLARTVQFLKIDAGATYLDCFIFFQSFGFAGLMLLARVFAEIEEKMEVPTSRGYWGLLFLPSVNFWTTAVGKDAPLFFAISLCTWAMLRLRQRLVYAAIALGIMMLFRAHIALMAAAALAFASLIGAQVSIGRKIGLMTVAGLGGWLALNAVQNTLGVDAMSASAVNDFLNEQNRVYATVGGGTSLGNAPWLVRVVSLLFRPFFFDSRGILGLIASVENVGVLAAFLYLTFYWRDVAFLSRRVLFIRFVLLFAVIILLSLTLVYYNIGLGLRQRVMAYPMVYSLLVALWSMRRKMAAPAAPQVQHALMPEGNRHRPVPEL